MEGMEGSRVCGLASGVETDGARVCGVGCLAWGYAGYVHTDTSRPRVLAILAMFTRGLGLSRRILRDGSCYIRMEDTPSRDPQLCSLSQSEHSQKSGN